VRLRGQKPGTSTELVTANRAQSECPVSPQMVRRMACKFVSKRDLVRIPTRFSHESPNVTGARISLPPNSPSPLWRRL
jgi:hypothetical protein